MSTRTTYLPGVPCWVAVFAADPHAARDFYGPVFGWAFTGPGGPDDSPYYEATLDGARVAGSGTLPEDASVRVDDQSASPTSRRPRAAWAMSALRTPDPDAAPAFYGAVFGWQAEPFGPATMWRLPGYVGGEPQQPVPRDVVAAMEPAQPTLHPSGRWTSASPTPTPRPAPPLRAADGYWSRRTTPTSASAPPYSPIPKAQPSPSASCWRPRREPDRSEHDPAPTVPTQDGLIDEPSPIRLR